MEENPSLEANGHTANQLINAPTHPPTLYRIRIITALTRARHCPCPESDKYRLHSHPPFLAHKF